MYCAILYGTFCYVTKYTKLCDVKKKRNKGLKVIGEQMKDFIFLLHTVLYFEFYFCNECTDFTRNIN